MKLRTMLANISLYYMVYLGIFAVLSVRRHVYYIFVEKLHIDRLNVANIFFIIRMECYNSDYFMMHLL